METDEVLEEVQEVPSDEIQEGAIEPVSEIPAELVRLSESEVTEALSASNLPDASRERLSGAEYETPEQLQGAITVEAAYVARLTGAGRPIGQEPQGQPTTSVPMTDEQYREALDAIDERFGVYRAV